MSRTSSSSSSSSLTSTLDIKVTSSPAVIPTLSAAVEMKKLFTAIETKNIDEVKKAIEAKISVNCLDTKQGTPLTCAINTGHLFTVKHLVEQKADIHGLDHLWHSPLYYAFEKLKEPGDRTKKQNASAILLYLLQHWQPPSSIMISDWIDYCKHYWEDKAVDRDKILDIAASYLIGFDITCLYDSNKDGHLKKYLGELGEFSGIAVSDSKFVSLDEGWNQVYFLPLRIRTLLGFLLECTADPQVKPNIVAQATAELQNSIETYSLLQIGNNIHEHVNPLHQDQFYNILVQYIFKRLFQLEDGQEFCLAAGWARHALYLGIMRHHNSFYLRLDNLGAGVENKALAGNVHGVHTPTSSGVPCGHSALLISLSRNAFSADPKSNQPLSHYLKELIALCKENKAGDNVDYYTDRIYDIHRQRSPLNFQQTNGLPPRLLHHFQFSHFREYIIVPGIILKTVCTFVEVKALRNCSNNQNTNF